MIFLSVSGRLRSSLPGGLRRFSNKASEPYIQGQSPQTGVRSHLLSPLTNHYILTYREYFYYVDHHGMLFQDDSRMKHWTAALKEKKLLFNFFKRLRLNETGRYQTEFKYISLCGRERNYVRCDDRPIVFTSGVGQKSFFLQTLHRSFRGGRA